MSKLLRFGEQLELEDQIMTTGVPPSLVKVIDKLEKQLENAQTKVSEIQAHISALKRIS